MVLLGLGEKIPLTFGAAEMTTLGDSAIGIETLGVAILKSCLAEERVTA